LVPWSTGPRNGGGDGRSGRRGAVPSCQAGLSHQPCDPPPSASGALALEGSMNARGTVGAAGVLVDGGDLLGQLGIPHRAAARGAVVAGVVGGPETSRSSHGRLTL
jgi:hypothetical protein